MENALESIIDELLLSEGITREDLELVDLNQGYSPVIPALGLKPMVVIKLEGGMYRVEGFETFGMNISKEELTIMRYRYLINR